MFIRHGQGLWFLISLAQNYIKELFEQCDCEADCGSEHVGAGTKHCPRDPGSWVLTQKLSDFPSSIPLWECQSNIPSPIYPIHPELDFTLTKTDSMNRYRKVWHQNQFFTMQFPNARLRRIGGDFTRRVDSDNIATEISSPRPSPNLRSPPQTVSDSGSERSRKATLLDVCSWTEWPSQHYPLQTFKVGESLAFAENKWQVTTTGTLNLSKQIFLRCVFMFSSVFSIYLRFNRDCECGYNSGQIWCWVNKWI